MVAREIYQSWTVVIMGQREYQAIAVEKVKDGLKSRKRLLKQALFAVYPIGAKQLKACSTEKVLEYYSLIQEQVPIMERRCLFPIVNQLEMKLV